MGSSIYLYWMTGQGTSSFNIYRGTTAGQEAAVPVATNVGGASTNNWTDTTAQSGTTYYYTVSAVNATGESVHSAEASASIPASTSGSTTGSSSGYPSSGYPGSGYPGSGYPSSGYPSSGYPSSGYPSSGYPSSGYPGSGYPSSGYPGMGGYPSSGYPGMGGYPNSGYPNPTPPSAPSSLMATAAGSSIFLYWTSSQGATSYNIYRGTAAGQEGSVPLAPNVSGMSGTTWTDSSAVVGTTYYYTVTAVSAAGESAPSSEASATLPNSTTGATTGTSTGSSDGSSDGSTGGMGSSSTTGSTSGATTSSTSGTTTAPPIGGVAKLDLLIGAANGTDYIGQGAYSASDPNSSRSDVTGPGIAAVYFLKVRNLGDGPGSYVLHGPAGGNGWTVRYYVGLDGNVDVTNRATTDGWTLAPLAPNASQDLRVEVTADDTVAITSTKEVMPTITDTDDHTIDQVGTITSLQKIAKVQLTLDGGQNWFDAPSVDDTAHATTVIANHVLGLRAVKANPNQEWPDGAPVLAAGEVACSPAIPEAKPYWMVEGQPSLGENTWVKYDDASPGGAELKTIKVDAGNTLSVNLKVAPDDDTSLVVDNESLVVSGGSATAGSTTLTTQVMNTNGSPAAGVRVQFTSTYASDGTSAGVLSGGAGDGSVMTDSAGSARVTLTAGPTAGVVNVTASLIGSDGVVWQPFAIRQLSFVATPAAEVPPPAGG